MKYISVILILLFILGCNSHSHERDFLNNYIINNYNLSIGGVYDYVQKRDIFNVKGSVKKITQTVDEVTINKDNVLKKERIVNNIINYLDSTIEKHSFDVNKTEDIDIYFSEIFTFDKNGRIKSITTKHPKSDNKFEIKSHEFRNNLLIKSSYSTSESGGISFTIFSRENNNIVSSNKFMDFRIPLLLEHRIFEYIEAENSILVNAVSINGDDSSKYSIFSKFENLDLVLIEEKDAGSEYIRKITIEYNENGDMINLQDYKNETIIEEEFIEYKYDFNNNWIEKRVYTNKKLSLIVLRNIEYN